MAALPAAMAQQVETPPRGSALRAELLEAVRPAVEAVLHPPVEFVVTKMNVAGDWAFVAVDPQRPGGVAIDPMRTRLASEARAGVLDGFRTYALLWFRNGRWNLIAWATGPTDVVWEPWPETYGAPRAIFR